MSHFPSSRRPRLLLVDDHEDLANLTSEFLRDAGLEVRIAKSAGEALELAAVFLPEIVLCDMSLPDMSGLEVGRALRVNPHMKDVFFVIHTAMAEADIRLLAPYLNRDEVNMIIPKPLSKETLDELVAGAAKSRRHDAQESKV